MLRSGCSLLPPPFLCIYYSQMPFLATPLSLSLLVTLAARLFLARLFLGSASILFQDRARMLVWAHGGGRRETESSSSVHKTLSNLGFSLELKRNKLNKRVNKTCEDDGNIETVHQTHEKNPQSAVTASVHITSMEVRDPYSVSGSGLIFSLNSSYEAELVAADTLINVGMKNVACECKRRHSKLNIHL